MTEILFDCFRRSLAIRHNLDRFSADGISRLFAKWV